MTNGMAWTRGNGHAEMDKPLPGDGQSDSTMQSEANHGPTAISAHYSGRGESTVISSADPQPLDILGITGLESKKHLTRMEHLVIAIVVLFNGRYLYFKKTGESRQKK